MSIKNNTSHKNNLIFQGLFVVILGISIITRFYGILWDEGFTYSPHPDERAILMKVSDLDFPSLDNITTLLSSETSSWNPRWFAYGSFPMYLLDIIYSFNNKMGNNSLDIRFIARSISAIADIGTIIGIFFIGKLIFNKSTALLATFLISISPIHIQLSHFFAFDTILTCFTVWTLYFLCKLIIKPGITTPIFACSMIGLGIATKITILPIIATFIVSVVIFHLTNNISKIKTITKILAGFSVLLIIICIVQPYIFLDWSHFFKDAAEQSEMVRRIRDYPYTRQYINTTAYLYQFSQLGKWGLGWPLLSISLLGTIYHLIKPFRLQTGIILLIMSCIIPALILLSNNSIISIVIASFISISSLSLFYVFQNQKKQSLQILIIFCWLIPYIIITCSFEVKFLRYMLPITPFIILFGSAFVVSQFNNRNKVIKKVVLVTTIVGVSITAWYGYSMMNIYTNSHTAVRASNYIQTNIPKNSVLIKEHWEESLPDLYDYKIMELPIYEQDNENKIENLSDTLSKGDYLILYSNRLYGSVSRLNLRYPLMRSYYHSLFEGTLGYKLVSVEASYMSSLNIRIIEDTFKHAELPNPMGLSNFESEGFIINGGFADESFSVYDHPKVLIFQNLGKFNSNDIKKLIYRKSVELYPETNLNENISPTIKSKKTPLMLSRHDSTQQRSGGTWTGIIKNGFLSVNFPLLLWLAAIEFISFIAFPLTFVIFRGFKDKGYLFSKPIGILIVAYITWILSSLHISEFNATTINASLLIFSAISFVILITNFNEIKTFIKTKWKFLLTLEVLFLIAFFIFMTIRMMNPDLWHPYRGGEKPMDLAYLNAVLKSSVMPPYDPWFSGGYINYYYFGQFIVATLIHLTGITTEISYNLAVALFFSLTITTAYSIGMNFWCISIGTPKIRFRIIAGFITCSFIAILGNLDGAYQLIDIGINKLQGSSVNFNFWQSSRMMPPDPPGFEITEFPFFTFLFADLHAHLISIPFTLLAIALTFNIVISDLQYKNIPRKIIEFVIVSLVIGSLAVINTWDFPMYLFLCCCGIGMFEFFKNGGLNLIVLIKTFVKTFLVAIVSIALFLPYHMNSVTFFNSLELTTNTTTFKQLFSIHGLHLFILISASFFLIASNKKTESISNVIKLLKKISVIKKVAFLIFIICIITSTLYSFVIGLNLFIMIILLLGGKNNHKSDRVMPFIILLALLGLGLITGLEIWRVEGDIDRMNSVFKFYLQTWILLSISSAYFLYFLMSGKGIKNYKMKYIWFSCVFMLITASAIYPVLGTKARIDDRFKNTDLTLDGYKYTIGTKYLDPNGTIDLEKDMEGIKWLRQNIEGSPVVLEAFTPSYRWGARISVNTGLPTIIGWKWHQEQQRFEYRHLIEERITDVGTIYNGNPNTEIIFDLLAKYEVEYIYIGDVESIYYSPTGISKLKSGLNGTLSTVFSSDTVTIMRVNANRNIHFIK
jgi:YYY domain-containing protein